ncbi:MAG: GTPase Era [Bacteroidales bacterium]|jgi:GTP-binding protein Era|nr:GTPase Era [Bacteroidales bacterium]
MEHKSGFVNILGHPNVGKSTLMNALVGEKLSIITSKAQTTRHRIMGIVNGDDFQIVYSDTPGIVKPHYKLHESMMKFVDSALEDADVFLLVTEKADTAFEEGLVSKLNSLSKPVVLVLNKIDLCTQEEVIELLKSFAEKLPSATVIPVSALHKFNLDKVFDTLLEKLPVSPAYYPKDELTDRSMRFFVSEIIREKILLYFNQEIPYSVEVVVDEYKEKENITAITATIYVARESQKAILIGHQGKSIKGLGMAARKDIEEFIEAKVFLDLRIKVSKDWRDDPQQLKRFGYEL